MFVNYVTHGPELLAISTEVLEGQLEVGDVVRNDAIESNRALMKFADDGRQDG